MTGLAGLTAVAAGWAVLALAPPGPREPDPTPLALAAYRGIEARLSWGPLERHRPYGVARGGAAIDARAPLAVLAELERRGDLHGVGALALAAGDTRQASDYLERAAGDSAVLQSGERSGSSGTPAGDSAAHGPGDAAAHRAGDADLASDRAAARLAAGAPEEALALADAALETAPNHAAARWNRALALRDLGLERGAAEEMARLARGGEPGWSAEATIRAAALLRAADERDARVARMVAAGDDLIASGAGLSLDDARGGPGPARLYLYDAIRAAPSRDRALALRPLALLLDSLDPTGGGWMARAVDRAAAADFRRRAPLARTYAAIATGSALTGAERAAYLARARAAGQDDILMGALLLLGTDGRTVAPGDLGEFTRLARATGDPWFDILADEQAAQVETAAGDLLRAESLLLRATARCRAADLPHRCARAAAFLAEVYVDLHRLPEARRALAEARRSAAAGVSLLGDVLLAQLADLHSVADDALGSGLPLARAYARELVLRHPASCADRAWAHELVAKVLINQIRFDDARRELAAARPRGQACAEFPINVETVFVASHVVRETGGDGEVAALRAAIARLRADPATTAAHRALLDHAEGRLLIDRDPAAGEALLAAAIREADSLPAWSAEARKARAYSYSVLALAAGRRGDADRALTLLAEESHLEAPAGCVLGVAVEDRLRMAVVRGPDGAAALQVDADRRAPAIDPPALVPPALIARLAGCDAVDVLARPPIHGVPRLLPADRAWRYRAARRAPLPPGSPPPRRLIVADVEPPAALDLPRLAPWPGDGAAERLTGLGATPARVLGAMRGATEIELHAHGLVNLGESDASLVALSPDAAGRYALTAADVRAASLTGAPLVILAACRAGRGAAVVHEPWSLPAAFVFAGARAVIASAAPIPDAEAAAFFGDLRARVERGEVAAVALRDARRAWRAAGGGDWVDGLVVFE